MIVNITSMGTHNLVSIGKEKFAVPKYEIGIAADCPIGESDSKNIQKLHKMVDKCILAKEESDLDNLIKEVKKDGEVGLVLVFNEPTNKVLDVEKGRTILKATKYLSMLGLPKGVLELCDKKG